MAVEKAVELTGTGASIEDAVNEALDRASLTLEALTSFELVQITGDLDGPQVMYRVRMRVWFRLLERVHG